ncbi:AAA family ATPase [uncultured Thiodictyon sp.]|uniref:AAA family ATPase n=1 Tax=uncultured Thiodictyon sp. TaxID=1846217 RepID=UPI0025D13CBF|nr:AAA family ATPase [uncultured Thiodictyon sp.]
MSETVRQEFFRWIRSLDAEVLADAQRKLLNIFITYFDTLEPLGTAGGRRARKISELIQAQHATLSTTLQNLNEFQATASTRADRITELEIGPFRGFRSKETFVFDRKYTFLYGPNGSGKSSFCEGLEYALLGDIEEAAARRVALPDYIRNTETNSATPPVAYGQVSKQKTSILQNQLLYRFCFVEKNRIDGFARITAATAGVQKDRIATLFGLDAFSEFVDGFTDNFQQYLCPEPIKGKAFETEQAAHFANTVRLEQIGSDLERNDAGLQTLIAALAVPGINSLEDIRRFLIGADGVSGMINQLQQDKAEQVPADISLESLRQLPEEIGNIQSHLDLMESDLAEFQTRSHEVNFKDLYSALTAIADSAEGDQFLCPACKTPLSQVTLDPFANARNELPRLKSLTELQDRISTNARLISQSVRSAEALLQTIRKGARQASYEGQTLPSFHEIFYTEIAEIPTWSQLLRQELELLWDQNTALKAIQFTIENYNAILAKKRAKQSAVDKTILKYQEFNNRRVELTLIEDGLFTERSQLEKSVQAFAETNAQRLAEIEAERMVIEVYRGFCVAYTALTSSLKQYRDRLPQELSAGLRDKVIEYYNQINSHDPSFEQLASLSLPMVAGDKVTIRFIGSQIARDALHVLSEGHIKVLGLSILLAKIVHEKIGFIIFDDIVNAIDDDHRSGIAELLLTHVDFNNKQQIISCHGEQFINKLEHRLGASLASKEVVRYRFYPGDAIDERGVKVATGDSKHYLVQAQEAFSRSALKDAASKCRQAVESIAETLWKRLGKEKSISLTVKIRTPGGQPDLSTVVDSLIRELKGIDPNSVVYISFSALKDKYPWSILNKGSHEQDDLPEFERADIASVLKLLGTLEQSISNMNFATVISSKD